jgi:hypothetical protein
MAVEKNGAVRPVIHMTKPKGFSFNDNLNVIKMEKVHMNVARDFGYLLRESGKGTLMSKYDLKDAFKLIPAKPRDWKLQGFFWAECVTLEFPCLPPEKGSPLVQGGRVCYIRVSMLAS